MADRLAIHHQIGAEVTKPEVCPGAVRPLPLHPFRDEGLTLEQLQRVHIAAPDSKKRFSALLMRQQLATTSPVDAGNIQYFIGFVRTKSDADVELRFGALVIVKMLTDLRQLLPFPSPRWLDGDRAF